MRTSGTEQRYRKAARCQLRRTFAHTGAAEADIVGRVTVVIVAGDAVHLGWIITCAKDALPSIVALRKWQARHAFAKRPPNAAA